MIANCQLCPHCCGVNRACGQVGWCRAGDAPRVFRFGPHFGEEPPLCGTRGSGCIFFSRCTLKCLYCQNSPWSWRGGGEDLAPARLTGIMRTLAEKHRCENWNLVSPTPYLPFIRSSAHVLSKDGIHLPFVWNSSGYERPETLAEYADLCDCALFDLRYAHDSTAQAYSGVSDYVAHARAAIRWAFTRTPGSSGLPPLIVRILVLPGHADEAIESLAYLATELSPEIPISLMSQYAPAYRALETPPLNRCVTEAEYQSVTEAAADFGFENGWIQGFESRDPTSDLVGENMGPGEGTVGEVFSAR